MAEGCRGTACGAPYSSIGRVIFQNLRPYDGPELSRRWVLPQGR